VSPGLLIISPNLYRCGKNGSSEAIAINMPSVMYNNDEGPAALDVSRESEAAAAPCYLSILT
jgi:hypothetical protein